MIRQIAQVLLRVFSRTGNTERDPVIEEVDRRQAELAARLKALGAEVDVSRVSEDHTGDHR